jgi:hypothetical protein
MQKPCRFLINDNYSLDGTMIITKMTALLVAMALVGAATAPSAINTFADNSITVSDNDIVKQKTKLM